MPRRPPAEPSSRLPDVRDGLTRLERVTLHVLAEAQAERPGKRIASTLLYGRVLEHVSVSQTEFQAVLRRLSGGVIV